MHPVSLNVTILGYTFLHLEYGLAGAFHKLCRLMKGGREQDNLKRMLNRDTVCMITDYIRNLLYVEDEFYDLKNMWDSRDWS
jgi:hypothetical protein